MRIALKDIHTVKSGGRIYYYHRPTKTRLPGKPGSPEFMAAYNKCIEPPAKGLPGTFRALADQYRRSPEFKDLAPRTKQDYRKVLDYLDKPMGAQTADDVTSASLLILRDRIAEKRNWRFANYCLAVISVVFSTGLLRGKCKANPAIGVPKLKRPKSAPAKNRPWTDDELEAVLAGAPHAVALAVAISAYTALRQGDVLTLPWGAYQDGAIDTNQGKTGDPVWVPVHGRLRAILDGTKKRGTVMVLNERGKPYTSDGFRTMFARAIADLLEKKKVGGGLTFHGLRHTWATKLADAGADAQTIMAITGHKSVQMVEKYTKTADRKRRAKAGLRLVEANETSTKSVKIADSGVKSIGGQTRLKP
jgi:integrase